MISTCTKGVLGLSLALLLLGAAACTQAKPTLPTPTLVPLNVTPVLPASATEPPVAQATAVPAVGGTPSTEETAVPAGVPTMLPTPTNAAGGEQPTAVSGEQTQPTAEATQPATTNVTSPTEVPSSSGSTTTGGACPNPYTVQRGEWLYSIARKCGVTPQALLAANPGVGNTVYPGQKLTIPGGGSSGGPSGGQTQPNTSGQRTYVVQRGDNLYRIALKFNTTVQAIMTANNLSNANQVYAGQTLIIP